MMRVAVLTITALSLAACGGFSGIGSRGKGGKAISEKALPYRATLSSADDPRELAISVAPKEEASVDDLRESVRFQATRYCLFTFGSSDAEWEIDPETGDWAATQNGDTLTFNARCTGR